MATETIEQLVEGGKATAAPPLGPALGPMGVNIGEVVNQINEKTKSFKGMQVPVKVIVDTDTKEFDIEIGTPPASALIKKEANIEKGSGNPDEDKVADLFMEQIIKVAKMKESNLLGKTLKQKVKEVIGTCNSMGVLVEGVPAYKAIRLVNKGDFDKAIKEEKTELSEEQKKKLEEKRKKLQAEIEKRRAKYEKMAKEIIDKMAGKEKGEIKAKLREAKIPEEIITEVMPTEGAAPGVAPGAAPEAGAAPAEGEAGAEEAKPAEEAKEENKE